MCYKVHVYCTCSVKIHRINHSIHHVNFCPQQCVVRVWQSILDIQAGNSCVDCGVQLGTVQSHMGKGMETCEEYTGRYTRVSGDIPKTTSFKDISTSLENLTTKNLELYILHSQRIHGATRVHNFHSIKTQTKFHPRKMFGCSNFKY
jgi:hypothetical protein